MADASKFEGHTPGPWHLWIPTSEGSQYTVAPNVSPHVGLARVGCLNAPTVENAANARLMAAAPDLLAENQELRHHLGILCAHLSTTEDTPPVLKARVDNAMAYLRKTAGAAQ